jgi:hypothetical protein
VLHPTKRKISLTLRNDLHTLEGFATTPEEVPIMPSKPKKKPARQLRSKKRKPALKLRSKEAKQSLESVLEMDDNEKLKALLDAVNVVDNLPKTQRSAVMLGFLAGSELYRVNLAEIVNKPLGLERKTNLGKAEPVW